MNAIIPKNRREVSVPGFVMKVIKYFFIKKGDAVAPPV
jgi:hypothetical protein